MAVFRRQTHTWPRKRHTERRLYPRVSLAFPLSLEVVPDEPPVDGMTVDVGLGGVRLRIDRYLPLFARFQVAMDLPLTDRDGEVSWTTISTNAAVVRIDPDEEGDADTVYDVSLSFSKLDAEQERVMGTFLLQMLLFDPDAHVE